MNPRFINLADQGFPGVTLDRANGFFEAEIRPNVFIGLFTTPEIAAQVFQNLQIPTAEKGMVPV